MKIGIFDSGIGGLSVLHRALKIFPNAEYIYYADKAHVPYGEKKADELVCYIKEILDFFRRKEVDGILIACNTATSVLSKEIREEFPIPIVGMEPAVKKAVETKKLKDKRILVAATPVTIAGEKLNQLLEKVYTEHVVDRISLPKLVRFAENEEFESTEIDDYLRSELREFHLEDYEIVVLGCTHFNYFKKKFKAVFPGPIHFVDGNDGTLRHLQNKLSSEALPECEQKVSYFYSGVEVNETEMKQIERYMRQLDDVYNIE